MSLGQIALEGLEFYAYHGVYAEERTIGNRYEVDVYLQADLAAPAASDALSDAVDYEKVYRLIARRMEQPSKLLEHLAGQLAYEILQNFPQVEVATVSVAKMNPPVGGVCKRSRVSYTHQR